MGEPLKPRDYQLAIADAIKCGQSNLVVAPMGAGKTLITKLIIDKHFTADTVLIIVGLRSVILQYSQYFPESVYTWAVSGKGYDASKKIVFATYQTLQNRDVIDLSLFNVVIFDEAHQRGNTAIVKNLRATAQTVIGMTGTPLDNSNKLLTNWDNWIFGPTMREMITNNWLSQTRFFSFSDAIESKDLKIRQGEFTEESVRSLMSKEGILNAIETYIRKHSLHLSTKAIVYLNFIEEVETLASALSDLTNIYPIHSKMNNTDKLVDHFKNRVSTGVAISVRSLSVGVDIPDINRVLLGTLSNIHALLLQITWRGSRYMPGKVTEVLDFTGVLVAVDPYTDYRSRENKQTCNQTCDTKYAEDLYRHALCVTSCETSKDTLLLCNKPFKVVKNQPVLRYDWHRKEGEGCFEASPIYNWHFKSYTKPGSFDVYKEATCPNCGSVFKYTAKTFRKDPNNQILIGELRDETSNEVFIIEHNNDYCVVIDAPIYKTFEYEFCANLPAVISTIDRKLHKQAYFALTNKAIPELPNATVNESLNEWIPLINWTTKQTTLAKDLIKGAFTQWVTALGYKQGKVYFMMQSINTHNERAILKAINKITNITKKTFTLFEKTQLGVQHSHQPTSDLTKSAKLWISNIKNGHNEHTNISTKP